MALNAIVTLDNLREAQIASHMASNPNVLPEPSVYFQDFNFGATMWDAAYGNVDGGSVSGVGDAVADIAIDNVLEAERIKREEDDPAKDVGMLAEAGARIRKELADMQDVTLGNVTLKPEEIMAMMEVLDDPERKERASQDYAARNGVTIEQGRSEMDWMHRIVSLAEKKSNGTITAAEEAELERETSQPEFQTRFDTARRSMTNVQNNSDISLANSAEAVANAAPDVAVEAATQGGVDEQRAVTWQIDNAATQQEALTRRGFASTQVDELVERQANSGDELASMFGDVADPAQVAAVEVTSPSPVTEISPAPMRG